MVAHRCVGRRVVVVAATRRLFRWVSREDPRVDVGAAAARVDAGAAAARVPRRRKPSPAPPQRAIPVLAAAVELQGGDRERSGRAPLPRCRGTAFVAAHPRLLVWLVPPLPVTASLTVCGVGLGCTLSSSCFPCLLLWLAPPPAPPIRPPSLPPLCRASRGGLRPLQASPRFGRASWWGPRQRRTPPTTPPATAAAAMTAAAAVPTGVVVMVVVVVVVVVAVATVAGTERWGGAGGRAGGRAGRRRERQGGVCERSGRGR
ncbi:hypothetical protein I4F81_009548 [Pyropia yezoensis]|uniref:Uncharacterized protein n=1 Tax=Pyropia yezoensis TaxID=2788 RepID=A0ACC3CAD4_PYRYE|nr:hypothetical protein I4F81_009548 [Neopyropia yezoensis]